MNADDFVRFGGSLTADVLSFNTDAIPAPDTLFICMTRGESRIADELRKQFGGFRRVVIDVDGEQYEFMADILIRLLEGYEGAGISECEYVVEDNMNESEGMGDVWFRCTNCNTTFDYYADDWLLKQNYCPHCGAKVVSE